MGRTRRLRRRLQRGYNFNISNDMIFINIMKWLRSNKWIPTCDLKPVLYRDCGRGLMAKKPIKKGEVVFSLPYDLLITSDTVENSPVACVFHCSNEMSSQDVLSVFLVWEKQQCSMSQWYSYIKSLPTCFSLPLFCSVDELDLMPSFISSAVRKQKEKILSSFNHISETLKKLEFCKSCRKNPTNELTKMDFNYDDFLWAWTVVNTRSVFCQNKRAIDCLIKVTDRHCLALAPLLDMFNHSNDSDLKANLTGEGLYEIKATCPISKYSQIFIHYGHHSNLHLFLEYGFVIPDNIFDVVIFSIEEVLRIVEELFPHQYRYSSIKKIFVTKHNLYKDLMCSSEGISFSLRALIYLVTSPETERFSYQKTIYSNSYSENECFFIDSVSLKLIEKKIVEFNKVLNLMNNTFDETSESFAVAKILIKQFLTILNKAKCSNGILTI